MLSTRLIATTSIALLTTTLACSGSGSGDDEVAADETSTSEDTTSDEAPGDGDGDPGDGDGDASDTDPGDGDGDPGDGDGDTDHPAHLTPEHCPSDAGSGAPAGTGLFVGGGGTDGRVTSTLDGETWADVTTNSLGPMAEGHTRNLIRGVGYGGGVFVAVGGYDNSYVVTSCDGVNWRHDVLGTNVEGDLDPELTAFLSDVAYLDEVFVAAGGAGALLRSTDHGLSWSRVEPEWYEGHLRGIATGNGSFVATGHAWEGDVGSSIVSTDAGETWSTIQETPGALGRVVFGNGSFVSIGAQRCVVSTDGEGWTECGLAISDNLSGVHFVGDEFFVQSNGGQYWRSSDGTTWSEPIEGWLPDTIATDTDRYVMARWMQRGWAETIEGPWTTLDMGGLSEVVWGTVLWPG